MGTRMQQQPDHLRNQKENPKRSYWVTAIILFTLLCLFAGVAIIILGNLGVISIPSYTGWLTIFGSIIIPLISAVIPLFQSLKRSFSHKPESPQTIPTAQGSTTSSPSQKGSEISSLPSTTPSGGTMTSPTNATHLQPEGQMKGEAINSFLPNNAPFDVGDILKPTLFVGRNDERRWLLERLRKKEMGSIAALYGIPGIGKTTLAKEVAHILYEENCFPDGIVFMSCEGKTDALVILRDVLTRFDSPSRGPGITSFEELSGIARKLLVNKKVLIILDNVEPELESPRLIAPLLATGATLLVTSRQALSRELISGEGRHRLGILASDEALELFIQSLERTDLTGDEINAARQIVKDLGYHTLAVKLTGRYAATSHPDVIALAKEIKEDPGLVLALRDYDHLQQIAEIVFAKSVNTLTDKDQHFFTALAAFETTEFGRGAALNLAQAIGLQNEDAMRSLDLLVLLGLVDADLNKTMPVGSDRERLRLHPLIRAFIAKRFAQYSQQEQRTALLAIAKYYSAYVSSKQMPQSVLVYDEGNITASLRWAHAQKENDLVAPLCAGMQYFWTDRGRTSDAWRYLPWGIEAAEDNANKTNTSEDQLCKAHLQFTYAKLLQGIGKLNEATSIFQEIGETQAEETLNALGTIALARSSLTEAETLLKKSLSVARLKDNQWTMGKNLSDLGQVARLRGKPDEAEKYFQESLAIRRKVGDWRGEAWDLNCLAEVALNRGQLDLAEDYYQQALTIFLAEGDLFNQGIVRSNFGQIALRRGILDEAELHYQQSLQIRRQVSDKRGEGWDIACLGEICRLRGKLEEAETYYQRSLAICHDVEDRRGTGIVLSFLGKLALQQEKADDAERYFQQSLLIRREVEDQRGEGADLAYLGQVAEMRNVLPEAEDFYRKSLAIRREVNIAPDTADSLLVLGQFLVEKCGKSEEGCTLLTEAIRLYPEMWVPGKEHARKVAQALKCVQ